MSGMVDSLHDMMKSAEALDGAGRYVEAETALVELEYMKLADPDDYATRSRFF